MTKEEREFALRALGMEKGGKLYRAGGFVDAWFYPHKEEDE